DFDFEKPTAPLLASKSADAGHDQGTFELFDFPGNHREIAGAERKASVRLEEVRGGSVCCSGAGNVPGLSVGYGFSLSDFPIEEHNRPYLVVSLDATLRSHELESGGSNPGDLYRCTFRAIDSTQQFRPRRI